MATQITLPRTMTCAYLEPTLLQMQRLRDGSDEVIVDCSQLTFIDPCGLTLLASAMETPVSDGRPVRFDFLGVSICSYLQRMNFFSQFPEIQGVDLRDDSRRDLLGYLCELTRIYEEREAENAVETLAWAATGTIQDANSDDEDVMSVFHPIKYALSELVGNAVTHAKREGNQHAAVWVAAQFYPKPGTVKISVTDNGCGFLGTLNQHPSLNGETTHTAAIHAALQARVSCNRNLGFAGLSENQGVGLTTTARIARRANGGITIFSGNGVHSDTPSTRRLKRPQRLRAIGPNWQGVGIAIDLDRRNLPGIKVHELLPDDAIPQNHTGDTPIINFV